MPEQTVPTLSEKLRYTIEQLMIFLKGEAKVSPLDPDTVNQLVDCAKKLSEVIHAGGANEVEIWSAVKDLIKDVNYLVPSSPRYPLFPSFPQAGTTAQIQAHIIAFELFLNHRLRLDQLSLEKEAPLFSKALVLWRDVGFKLQPSEAISQLASIIMEVNHFLPEGERYPLPNPHFYL